MVTVTSWSRFGARLAEWVMYVVFRTAGLSQSPKRLAIVAIALSIIYLRTSVTFADPQMWGEDIHFFLHAEVFGWKALLIPEAGYLSFIQSLTAFVSQLFPPQAAAALYFYSAIALTLLVVWLVTSPRLALPSKPLLALAVVIVPMGYEEIGTITNIQWILPIGAFALLFMTPPRSKTFGIGAETIYLVLMALSGPFSIFMAPMFVWRTCQQAGSERRRLIILSMAVSFGAAVQIYEIVSLIHQDLGIKPTGYPWRLWITIPTKQMLTVFPGLSSILEGRVGIAAGVLLLVLAVTATFTGAYRDQKRCMVLLALGIALGGMIKFRAALDTQIDATRYFYMGSIFILWILCCASRNRTVQRALTLFVVAIELALLPVVASTPRTDEDFQWPLWARQIDSGLPIIIPTAPGGWYTPFPAWRSGPLYQYSRWNGRKLTSISPKIAAAECAGSIDDLQQLPKLDVRTPWGASGSVGDADHPHTQVRFIALVDDEDRVIGFGYKGFGLPEPAAAGATGWRSVFFSDPRRTLRAYAVGPDGTTCRLTNEVAFGAERKPIASGTLVEAVPLVAGRRVAQRFSPKHHIRDLTVTLVTWGRVPNAYRIDWHVVALHNDEAIDLGSGRIDAGSVRDWQTLALPVRSSPDPGADEVELTLEVSLEASVSVPVGVPLISSTDADSEPADVDGQPSASGGSIGLSMISDP